MKITNKLLKSKSPCKGGYIWFLEKYGNKAKVDYETLIKDAPEEHKGWIKEHLYVEPPIKHFIHPDYKGNLKIGQEVYYENAYIGMFFKTKIVKIEKGWKGEFKVFMDTPYSPACNYDLTQHYEDSVFVTFDKLKTHWIERIVRMKEEEE